MPNVYANFSLAGVRFEAGLNGAPLFTGGADQQFSTYSVVDPWVLPENNAITVRIAPPADSAPRKAWVFLELRPDSTGDGEALFRFEWRHEGPPFEPFQFALPFVPHKPVKSAVWIQAEKCTELSDSDRAAISDLAMAIVATAAAKDVAGLLDGHFATRTADSAALFGNDRNKYAARLKEAHERLFAEGSVSVVSRENLRLSLVAGGRAVLVRNGASELLDTGDASIAIYVAKLAGKWTVVR